jgi:DNA topoisomerase I
MKLLIIESPGKREKLSAILGSDWKVSASIGHIRDLPEREMGIDAPDFTLRYELTERGQDVVKRLQADVERAQAVYLATDPDREGEAISWHLRECLQLGDRYERIAFNEITASAVRAALAAPRKLDMGLVHAQEARRALDRLVGYTASPALSRAAGERLSAGRVQSPAVRLVVERERAIRAFKQVKYYTAQLSFAESWTANWLTKPYVTEEQPYVLQRSLAERAAAVRELLVTEYEAGAWRRSPPAPFCTSTLQQAASVTLGFNPGHAMKLAQKLYESGHITYHRTDNPNISAESLPALRAQLLAVGVPACAEHRVFEAPEGAQAGHPAITPTHWTEETAGDSDEERALYRLIRVRALASQAEDAEYATRLATLEGGGARFEARGRTLVNKGWLALQSGDATEEADEDAAEPANPVPELSKGARLHAISGKVVEKRTKAPKRYTEASLVKKLEAEGIGRPSTYASIIEAITSPEKPEWALVRREKKFLVPTPKGELLVDSLVGRCRFIDFEYTKGVNRDLDEIAGGKRTYRELVAAVHEQLGRELQGLEAGRDTRGQAVICPECGKPMTRRVGKNGPFWSCSGYPNCKRTLDDRGGAPVDPNSPPEHPCPKCGAALRRRQSANPRGASWWGCTAFPTCKAAYPDKRGAPDLSGKPAAPKPYTKRLVSRVAGGRRR